MENYPRTTFGSVTITHDLTELPFRLDPSFDAISFIALYRMTERQVFRSPSEEKWLSRLALLQAVLDKARSPEIFPTFRENVKQALDLFASVLQMEGMGLGLSALDMRLINILTAVAIMARTRGTE